MRALPLLALLVAAASATAQGTKTQGTKTQGTKTQGTKTQGAPATKTPTLTKNPAATTKSPAGRATKGPGQQQPALAVAPETVPTARTPVIMREIYEYDGGGRRDPFLSLLTSSDLRPTVADLRLVIVLYDETGRRPVAVMRDLTTNTQYRVTTGMTLGRMRVAQIKRRAVIFTIEEFGLNRQDSLVLGDTSKVRAR